MLVFWVFVVLPLFSGRGLHHPGPPVAVVVGPLFPFLLGWPSRLLGLGVLGTIRSLVGLLAGLVGSGLGAYAVQVPAGLTLGSLSLYY